MGCHLPDNSVSFIWQKDFANVVFQQYVMWTIKVTSHYSLSPLYIQYAGFICLVISKLNLDIELRNKRVYTSVCSTTKSISIVQKTHSLFLSLETIFCSNIAKEENLLVFTHLPLEEMLTNEEIRLYHSYAHLQNYICQTKVTVAPITSFWSSSIVTSHAPR